MIKIEYTEVFGWSAAIRGMRNPMNSWEKSDSFEFYSYDEGNPYIGNNDKKLMRNLAKTGDDHGKVIRYLDVFVDITAPLYWWKEFRTYRKGRKFMDDGDDFTDPDELEMHIETNSCSTMHKIHAKEFTMDDFSHEHLTPGSIDVLNTTIQHLNFCRRWFLADGNKEWWWQIIQLLPSSYNQKRTVKLNYQVIKNMYNARKNHKLDEWHDFCAWCESLPYFMEIIGGESSDR